MPRHALSLFSIFVLACGGSTPEPAPEPVRTSTTAGAEQAGDSSEARAVESNQTLADEHAPDTTSESDPPPPEPACAATFAEARGHCVAGPATSTCNYPEGRCYCGEDPVCSGAMRPPMPPEMYAWQCTPTPPEVREDGCPGTVPNEGVPCMLDHGCGYGFCGGPSYDCVDGEWHMTDPGSDPP